jgi:hypothetical protein
VSFFLKKQKIAAEFLGGNAMNGKFHLLICIVVSLALMGQTARGDLLAHLEFEGNIDDSSSNNIPFEGNPGVYVTGPGGFGQSMSFDKANGNVVYAEWLYTELASLNNRITIAFWAYGNPSMPYPQEDPSYIFSASDEDRERMNIQLPHSSDHLYVFWDSWDTSGNFERVYKYVGDSPEVIKGQWNHWAFVKDTTLSDSTPENSRVKIYLNGDLWFDSATSGYDEGDGTVPPVDIRNIYVGAFGRDFYYYDGKIEDFRLYDVALTESEIESLMVPIVGTKANTPEPIDGAGGKATYSVVLKWYPGTDANTHDVYLGTNYNDVNDANTLSSEYMGNQTIAAYDPGILDANTTYFWRIDEVNGLSVVKGDVWSFSVAPDSSSNLVLHYKLNGNLDDSAGSGVTLTERPEGSAGPYVSGPVGFDQAMYFNKTAGVYGNVVYAEGIGSTLSSITDQYTISFWAHGSDRLPFPESDPTVIFSGNDSVTWSRISLQLPHSETHNRVFFDTWGFSNYCFDRMETWIGWTPVAYKWRWNHWAFVKNLTQSNTSPETSKMKIYLNGQLFVNSYDYGINPTCGVAGIENIYIGAEKQYWYFWDGTIDDVRIYNAELSPEEISAIAEPNIGLKAHTPNPADGADEVAPDTDLTWYAGKTAVSHDVYLGTSFEDVNDANTTSPEYKTNQTSTRYDPNLGLDTDYYWRIDEVTPSGTVKGDVWSFTTREYIVIEDFEVYTDTNALRLRWVEDANSNYLDPNNSFGGVQSMRLEYENQNSPYYTEVEREFVAPQDWTVSGMEALSIRFRGDMDNVNTDIYVKVTDGGDSPAHTGSVTYAGPNTIAKSEVWREWNIDLQAFAAQDVNISDVNKITLGVGTGADTGQTNVDFLYFDDIRLYPPRCVSSEAVADWVNDDCTTDFDELGIFVADWLEQTTVTTGYDGLVTGVGEPNWVSGKFNNGLEMSNTDYIEVNPDVLSAIDREITISLWAYGDPDVQPQDDTILIAYGPEAEVILNINLPWSNSMVFWDTGFAGHGTGSCVDRIYKTAMASEYEGAWVHWVFTKDADASDADPANARMKIYRNGVLWHDSSTGPYGLGDGSSSINGAVSMYLGGNVPATYAGKIDDFRIYDRQLSQAEIQSISDGSLGTAGQPLLWYKLDESSGTVAEDSGSSSGTQITWPFYYETNLVSSNPERIDFEDFAELASYWLELQLFP